EQVVGHAARLELGLDQLQALDELREQQHLVAFGQERLQQLEQRLELAGAEPVAAAGKCRVAADLAEPRERGEHRHAVAVEPLRILEQRAEERASTSQLGEIKAPVTR